MSVDWPNKLITVPQADLSLVSGTLYTMDTETYFRTSLMALMDDEQGMAWPTPLRHNTEVTVAGVTYARTIELINGYQVQFTPNSQWTVRLEGSNNNLFDVENSVLVQNQVQVIPTNSAGLQTVTSGSGVLPQDITDIKNAIFDENVESTEDLRELLRILRAALAGKASESPAGTWRFRDLADAKDRIVSVTDTSGARTSVTTDGT